MSTCAFLVDIPARPCLSVGPMNKRRPGGTSAPASGAEGCERMDTGVLGRAVQLAARPAITLTGRAVWPTFGGTDAPVRPPRPLLGPKPGIVCAGAWWLRRSSVGIGQR